MKNFVISTAVAALAIVATPAFAGDFSGPRLEATAGADNVTRGIDKTDVSYGVGAGYDLQFGKVVAGVEAGVNNVFDRRDVGVGARLGYVVNENVLLFTKVSYSNWKPTNRLTLEGVSVGGGLEVNIAGPVYAKVEYRHTDFKGPTGKNSGIVGLGYRF